MKAILTIAALALSATAAIAEPVCGPALDMWEGLEQYGESRQSIAIHIEGDAAVETWANEDTGSWTVILTSPTGISCIALHGMGWADTSAPEGDPA